MYVVMVCMYVVMVCMYVCMGVHVTLPWGDHSQELEGKVRSSLEDSINRVREKSHSLDKLKRSAEEFLARVEASHREMLEKIDIKEQEIMAELSKRMYTLREQLACAKSSKGGVIIWMFQVVGTRLRE